MSYTVGIDVGGTKTALGLFDDSRTLISKRVMESAPDLPFEEMMNQINGQLDALLVAAKVDRSDLLGVGIGLPGHVHFEKGLLLTAPNLPNWAGKNVRAQAENLFRVPCLADNDANVAALAEFIAGAGRGSRNMAYVTISTGVGCGLVLNGRLFHGSYGAAGEIGHLFVSDSGSNLCGCGRTSCVEAMSSGTGMASYARLRIQQGAKSILPELSGGTKHITAKHIALAAKRGDPLATEVADRAAEGLARAFYNLYQLINCETLVYGGGVGKFGPLLFDRIEQRFFELIPMAREYPMRFLPSLLGDDAGILGAALLLFHRDS
ncbi:MAG: ROK family protein [Christensenellales bacterium]|jgi:glucokinase